MGKPKAVVNTSKCLACCACIAVCPQDAIEWIAYKAQVDPGKCTSCAICIRTCPVGAIAGRALDEI